MTGCQPYEICHQRCRITERYVTRINIGSTLFKGLCYNWTVSEKLTQNKTQKMSAVFQMTKEAHAASGEK